MKATKSSTTWARASGSTTSPAPADQRHARALHRRALGHGAHLEPDDLRPRHQEQHAPTTTPSARSCRQGKSGEELFFELALEDLTQAADLFRPIYEQTNGVDGWVSLEVSPLLAHDTAQHLAAAKDSTPGRDGPTCSSRSPAPGGPARHRGGDLRRRADQRDPAVLARALRGGRRGLPARHRAAHRRRAESRRRLRGLGVRQPLGRRGHGQGARARCATGSASPSPERTYKAYRDLLDSPRWQRVYNAGARPQRLLWASTGTKDPKASDVLYIKALAAPFTVNTMPEGTLKAFADHGEIGAMLPATAATARRCWPSSPRPASTSTPWPPSSRTKERSRSSSPGTS